MAYRCVVCKNDFADAVQARQSQCKGDGGHVLQPLTDGSKNPDTGDTADFRSIDESDRAKWGEEAKRVFGDDQ